MPFYFHTEKINKPKSPFYRERHHRADQDSVVARGNSITAAYQDKRRNAKLSWNKGDGRHNLKSNCCCADLNRIFFNHSHT